MQNLDLYKSLVNSCLDKVSNTIPSSTIAQMKAFTNAIPSEIPLILDSSLLISSSNWSTTGLTVEEKVLEDRGVAVLQRVMKLWDSSMIAIQDDGPAIIYNENLSSIKGVLPFSYTTPSVGLLSSAYETPSHAFCISWKESIGSDVVDRSLLGICMDSLHVVQLYLYDELKKWTHVDTIGQFTVSGSGPNTLTLPSSASAFYDEANQEAIILVANGTGNSSFLKRFRLSGNVLGEDGIISNGIANAGSMAYSELKDIQDLHMISPSLFFASSSSSNQFAVFSIKDASPYLAASMVQANNLKDLIDVGDSFANPKSLFFDPNSGLLLVGDDLGHVGIFDLPTAKLKAMIGKPKGTLGTQYPLAFKSIKSVGVWGSSMIWVEDNKLWSSNLNTLPDQQELIWLVEGPSFDFRILSHFGLDSFSIVEYSFDGGSTWSTNCQDAKLRTASQVFRVRVKKTREELINSPSSPIPYACVVVGV